MILINPLISTKYRQSRISCDYLSKPIVQNNLDSCESTSKNISFGINPNFIIKEALKAKNPDNINFFRNSDTFNKFLNNLDDALTYLEDEFIKGIKTKDKAAVEKIMELVEKFAKYWEKIDDSKTNPKFTIFWEQDLRNNPPPKSLAHSLSNRLAFFWGAENYYADINKNTDKFIEESQKVVPLIINDRK